jgi:hypothetical protein
VDKIGKRNPFDDAMWRQTEKETRQLFLSKGMTAAQIEDTVRQRYEGWLLAKRHWEDRVQVAQGFGTLFNEILTILNRHDLVGIADEGNPYANMAYEYEAVAIIPRLCKAQTVDDAQRIVTEEFSRWFGASTFRGQTSSQTEALMGRFRLMVEDIWEAWKPQRKGPGHQIDR